jgi:tetratricopeptide (TPR) repeat protein
VCGTGSSKRSKLSSERVAAVLSVAIALLAGGCGVLPSRTWTGSAASEIVTHEVALEESLESIADDYYGDPEAAAYLARVNGLRADEGLTPGDRLEVPVTGEDVARHERRTEAKLYYNRGTLFAERGDLPKAAEEFRKALRVDPRFADAGYNLGVVLLLEGEPRRAVAIFEQAAGVRPEDASILYGLGKAYLDDGRVADGLATFDRALAVDPDHEDALFARAVSLLRLGRREDAVVALDSYVRRFPSGAWAEEARGELKAIAREAEQDR